MAMTTTTTAGSKWRLEMWMLAVSKYKTVWTCVCVCATTLKWNCYLLVLDVDCHARHKRHLVIELGIGSTNGRMWDRMPNDQCKRKTTQTQMPVSNDTEFENLDINKDIFFEWNECVRLFWNLWSSHWMRSKRYLYRLLHSHWNANRKITMYNCTLYNKHEQI